VNAPVRSSRRTFRAGAGRLLGLAVAALTATLATPAAPAAEPVVDELFGRRVEDPFRWLERLDDPEVAAWARARDAAARAWLAAEAPLAAAARAVDAMSAYRKIGDLVERGGRRFYLAVEPGDPAPRLWVEERDGGARRLLVPPAPAPWQLVDYAVSPDGARLAYAVAAPGERDYAWSFLDVASGEPLPGAGARGRIAVRAAGERNPWSADGATFVYVDAGEPDARRRIVALGVGGDALAVLHECDAARRCEAVVGPRDEVVVRESGDDGDTLWLRSLAGGAPRRLAGGGSWQYVGAHGRARFLLTDDGAPRRRIVAVDLGVDGAPSPPREVVAESPLPIEQAHLFGGRLVLLVSRAARSEVRIHALDGALERAVTLPDGLVWNLAMRHWSGLTGDPESSTAFVRSLGPTAAGSILALDLAGGALTVAVRADIPLPLEQLASEQVTVPIDGAAPMPMFLVGRRDAPRGEAARVLLFVYGAFGWTARPFLNAKYAAWLDAGGVIAMPNVRGDGVHGPDWHAAGRGINKGSSARDVARAAEWLIAAGRAAPGRIALDANSAGTVAAGAALLARPELFGAALLEVPISDIVRATSLPGGEGWGAELGAPTGRAELDRVLSYSPYHLALAARCPPPTLVTAGDLDTTAVPSHAYKLAAALARAGEGCERRSPALLRVDWGTDHGANKPEPQRRAEWAAELAFLDAVMPPAAPAQSFEK